MRNLEMNKRPIIALNYIGKVAVKDADNNMTGEYTISYSDEINFKAHISGARGNAMVETIGVDLDYDKSIVMGIALFKELAFNENTVFFIDKTPEYDGSKPLYDYKIKRICETLNEVVIQVQKVRNE